MWCVCSSSEPTSRLHLSAGQYPTANQVRAVTMPRSYPLQYTVQISQTSRQPLNVRHMAKTSVQHIALTSLIWKWHKYYLCLSFTVSFGSFLFPVTQNSLQTGIMELSHTQGCKLHVLTSNAMFLPAATSSTAHHPHSPMCPCSWCSVTIAEACRMCLITLQRTHSLSPINLLCHEDSSDRTKA
jgi:hypothetical protein